MTLLRSLVDVARSEIERVAPLLERYPGVCVYCGDGSTTVDHLAPRSYSGWHFVVVPACRRCNTILGALPYASIPERSAHVLQREQVKNRVLLRGVRHDLETYGYGLRSAIVSRECRREILHARMSNLAVGGIGDARFRVLDF